jgi:hypothetical protein
LRVLLQAAAAIVVFVVTTAFTIKFYPVFAQAFEESRVRACQERLRTIAGALVRFRAEHPECADFRGLRLKGALVEGGYAREEVFACPSVRDAPAGALCYFLRLPDERAGVRALAWDHFGNHGSHALNMVDEKGRPVLLEGEQLWAWLPQQGGEAR